MRAIQDALFEKLGNTPNIANRLALYQQVPAIFTSTVPDSVTGTYLVIRDPFSNEAYDTKTSRGRAVLVDIGIFGVDDGDVIDVQDVAEEVRELLHRCPLVIDGYGTLIAQASGPILAPTEDQVYGRIVQVRLVVIKA